MTDVWSKVTATTRVTLGVLREGAGVEDEIRRALAARIEGICGPDGYIKPGSVRILTISVPKVVDGDLEYDVVYEATACLLADGLTLTVVAKDITKAGIRAVLRTSPSPIVVFIARDHHNTSTDFNAVSPGDDVRVKILGQRFELGDRQVSAIATMVDAR